jgi:hypothetical protein
MIESKFKCPRCKKRGKTWEGDDPVCGFDEEGNFLLANWNCATLNALREICEISWCDDYNIGVTSKSDFGFLILKWYKSRGGTDRLVNDGFEPASLKEALIVLGDIDPPGDWGVMDATNRAYSILLNKNEKTIYPS